MRFLFALFTLGILPPTPVWAQTAAGSAKPATRQQDNSPVGYTDTPMLPDGKWRVHDLNRPHPRKITPGTQPGMPPSDAIVLFDGKDLSKWGRPTNSGVSEPAWRVENGSIFAPPRAGDLVTKQAFGDMQLHIEWASPEEIRGSSQNRGNSGVIIMGFYEVQVLDSWENLTYADGQAGAMYGQYPPMVNAARKPGEWQVYDIVFEAPRWEGEKLTKPAHVTVFHNGVVLHHRQPFLGRMAHRELAKYIPHAPELPLLLQDHGTRTRFRNIWVRKLTPYDQQ